MSIASEITRLQNAKSALKSSINAKTDEENQITDETLDEYADFVDSIQTGGGGGSVNEFRIDIEYGEATGYEYVLKTSWSEIQTFLNDVSNNTNTRSAVLYINNIYTSHIWRTVTNGLAFIEFGASGEGSNFSLNVTSYEIKQNGIQDFYRLVMTQED